MRKYSLLDYFIFPIFTQRPWRECRRQRRMRQQGLLTLLYVTSPLFCSKYCRHSSIYQLVNELLRIFFGNSSYLCRKQSRLCSTTKINEKTPTTVDPRDDIVRLPGRGHPRALLLPGGKFTSKSAVKVQPLYSYKINSPLLQTGCDCNCLITALVFHLVSPFFCL